MIRIVGDGIAGSLAALALRRAGADVVLHGDGAAAASGARTLVHRHAGRSFRTDPLEDEAWPLAVAFLRGLVATDAARELEMVRPVQERLAGSVEVAADPDAIRRLQDPRYGDVFRYGPAFSIDVGAALGWLHDLGRAEGVTFQPCLTPDAAHAPDVIAVGAALAEWVDGLDLQLQGGHLVTFEAELDHAVSARGVHVVPAAEGRVCAGSTWWDPDEPMTDREAVAELRGRLDRAEIAVGEATDVWRGVRCIHAPDRRPLLGRLGEAWIVGALGTRGWLWAPWLADKLVASMNDGAPVPARLDVGRTDAVLKPTE